MSKNNYFITTSNNIDIVIDSILSNKHAKYSLNDLIDLNIQYYDVYDIVYSNLINEDTICEESLSDILIISFIDYVTDYDETHNIEFNKVYNDFIESFNYSFIIKHDIKNDDYKFLTKHQIIKRIKELKNDMKHIINNINYDFEDEELTLFNFITLENYDDFLKIISKSLEKDRCHVFLTDNIYNPYDGIFCKKDSLFYKKIFKNDNNNEMFFHNDLYHEHGYPTLFHWITRSLSHDNNIMSCVISTPISEFKNDESDKNVMLKKYGFILYRDENKLITNQLSAQEVMESYTKNYLTGEYIKPDKREIYCGKNNEDVICAFDLI